MVLTVCTTSFDGCIRYVLKHKHLLITHAARESKWVTYAPGDYVSLSSDQLVIITRGIATTNDRILVRGSVLGLAELATLKRGLAHRGKAFLCVNFVEALLMESASVEKCVRTEVSQFLSFNKKIIKKKKKKGNTP